MAPASDRRRCRCAATASPSCASAPISTRDPTLWVASVRVVPIVDMLLGADWLGSRRVWLSFATKQMFVAGRQGS